MTRFGLALFLATAIAAPASAETLRLRVLTDSGQGTVRVGVFSDQAGFDAERTVADTDAPARAGATDIVIKGLKPGRYGVALFQDKNNNGKFDTNAIGIPKEPFGFSRNPRIRLRAPSFESFSVTVGSNPVDLEIRLN